MKTQYAIAAMTASWLAVSQVAFAIQMPSQEGQFTKSTATHPRFSALMERYKYDWEALDVLTSDGYILTTFHITSSQAPVDYKIEVATVDAVIDAVSDAASAIGDFFSSWWAQTHTSTGVPTKPSVLIQHGFLQDGTAWLESAEEKKPMHLLLADQGYDVWIANSRGTMYSQGHKTLDAATDTDYWDYTWTDMKQDAKANIAAIKQATGEDKIFYLGYSQGTALMHYALATDEEHWFKDNLLKAVHLAPCFAPDMFPNVLKSAYNSSVAQFRNYGIHAINGPNWVEDSKKICEVFDWFTCWFYTSSGLHGERANSVKQEQHWIQNGITDEFQEFQEHWLEGDHSSRLIDVSNIQDVPMAFFIGDIDLVCPSSTQYEYIAKIKAPKTVVDISQSGHNYFTDNSMDEWFMSRLLKELQI